MTSGIFHFLLAQTFRRKLLNNMSYILSKTKAKLHWYSETLIHNRSWLTLRNYNRKKGEKRNAAFILIDLFSLSSEIFIADQAHRRCPCYIFFSNKGPVLYSNVKCCIGMSNSGAMPVRFVNNMLFLMMR